MGGEVLGTMLTWGALHRSRKAPELAGAPSPLCDEGREERLFSSAVQHPPGALRIVFPTRQHNPCFSKPSRKRVSQAGAPQQRPEEGWGAEERRASWEGRRGGSLGAEGRASAACKDLGGSETAMQGAASSPKSSPALRR